MNVLLIFLITIAVFILGYRFYARYIEKIFDVDGSHVTPAVEVNDGIDYVPTKKIVIFGHHFASIAGGGPIIGPTVALIFGYIPVWLWIMIGTLFIGAVHDFTALLASMRERGKSMAEIAEKTMGRAGFFMFIAFTIIMLLMLTSVFLTLTATALSSKYPLSYFGTETTHIQTIVENGIAYAVIGGIASSSVIFITCCAPLIGWLLYKKGVNAYAISALAVFIAIVSIQVGIAFPIKIDPFIWMIVLSIYTLFAAGVPVWLVLQPRDFTNSFMLYAGVIGMIIGTIIVGLKGVAINIPANNITGGNMQLGYVWPILFITVACGAISGFHALVAGGTTSKQVSREKPDAKVVSYGGMWLETLLAVCVIIAVGVGLSFDQFTQLVFPTVAGVKSNPILAFALGLGGLLNKAVNLPLTYGVVFGILLVEGFVVTTLDTAVRLNRYLLEELWSMLFRPVPKILKTYAFNSFLCVILMFLLAYYNVFAQLWMLFGSANQLLAALTMLAVSLWLMQRNKSYLFALLPGLFMLVTTIASLLVVLFNTYLPKQSYILAAGDIVLLGLAAGVLVLFIKKFRERQPAAA